MEKKPKCSGCPELSASLQVLDWFSHHPAQLLPCNNPQIPTLSLPSSAFTSALLWGTICFFGRNVFTHLRSEKQLIPQI